MTSLQKQLAVIAATSTHQLDLKAQKLAHGKSLLFEPRVAASQSFEAIYQICYQGYRDLCALDPRFVQFSQSLFSEQSKVEDRTQMTQKENSKLNGVLEAFLTMVGPRLLLKPAEKAVEWLVRRFRVHEYNAECLVMTYLPYHNTPQFLALLSIVPASPPHALRFLHPYIQSPTNPPRQTIVYTAVNTPAFFNAFQNYVVKVLDAGHQGSSLLSFWATVTTQAIDGILDQSSSGRRQIQDQRVEEVLLRVLPVLNACMKISSGAEAVIACYMIIIVLVTKATFEDKVLDSLMEASILSQDSETLDACLMCLAIVAEERSQIQLPKAVTKRLIRIPSLGRTLVTLSKQCRVDRLALGCALGALEGIANSEERQKLFQGLIDSKILDEPQFSAVSSAVLHILKSSKPGSFQHNHLIQFASTLAESPAVLRSFEVAAKKDNLDLELLGFAIARPLEAADGDFAEDEDEDMLDANGGDESSNLAILPPEITIISFLHSASLHLFQEVVPSFENAVASGQVNQYLAADTLQRNKAFESPLFFSFLIRVWCSHCPISTRSAALRAATTAIKEDGSACDLQNLIPYLLFALADPSLIIRRSAASCIAALSANSTTLKGTSNVIIWGSSSLYDTYPKKESFTSDQTSDVLSFLVSMLEESAMDSDFVINTIRGILGGNQSSKASKKDLKPSIRAPLIYFLNAHIAATPLLKVRLRLLPLSDLQGKFLATIRINNTRPILKEWFSLSQVDAMKRCEIEQIDITDAERGHFFALLARESESMDLIQSVISGDRDKERRQLLQSSFEWIGTHWSSMRSESRLLLSQQLLDLSLKESDTSFDRICKTRALETLRNVKLDTSTLVALLDSIPSSLQMPEGPPTKRRRRTSRNEMARAEIQSPGDISRILQRLTLVLELVEASTPREHPSLFKSLFGILGELQQLKQQSGSDLVYLQSLILGSLTPIVTRIKSEKDTAEYQAAVRADLLIDCIRHSASPQVQNAALLLIGTLASWVPEMILHNLMPIFTFIGSSLLRQQDDYSAHVVDQTISRVIPPLAASLRAKHKNFLTGVADLLLSFTAAFEHIPQHRRLKLFSELARTLGPEDSLSAIIALLVDRYPINKSQRRFAVDLLLVFDPIMTLQTIANYLVLVEDAAGSKRKVANTLFSLSEKQPGQVENVLINLTTTLAELVADERLQSHVAKTFRRKADSAQPRAIFANIVETAIRISKLVAQQPKVYQSCSRVLGRCLNLLPTADLIESVQLLLENPDEEVKIAAIRSVEVRAGVVAQNDKSSAPALVAFLPDLDSTLQQAQELDVKRIALSCIDSIISRFGKRDAAAVTTVAETVAGPKSLASGDDRIRILSLLCLTSVIDIVEDEAISLLPTVLPTAFEYLGAAIEQENSGLHNAVYTLLNNTVQRLGYMFSRDYLVPVLKLSQQSAAGGLDDSCDEERTQFYQAMSLHLEAHEVFTALQSTWENAIARGSEALDEQFELIRSTIESQPKSELVKASSTLFSLLLDVFKLRNAVAKHEEFDNSEVEQLEDILVESVIAMTLKLNDATFRPFFVQLVDLAANSSITFYKFLAVFFDRFKSIVTSYSSYITEHSSKLLDSLAKQKGESDLRTAVLNALQRSFEHDQDGFWQAPSHFSAILNPLLAQLTINSPTELAEDVIPAITSFAAASSSSTDNHREMNALLLKYMRAEEAHTRLATVKCEQALTKKLGEEWLGLLPEMLPFISELREDDDEMVERETQRWITEMEEILGEDLDAMLQ